MHQPAASRRTSDTLWPASNRPRSIRQECAALHALFEEVAALANQLRKPTAFGHQKTNGPLSSSVVLQVLDLLGRQTVPAIARARALSRQNIQVLVNRLESQGFVALAPNPAHKRSPLVQLTDSGRNLITTVEERQAHTLQKLLPHVSSARLVSALRLLQRLRSLLAGEERPTTEPSGEVRIPRHARPSRRQAGRGKAPPVSIPPAPLLPVADAPADDEFPVNLL